ncbi:MAG: bile acid:sodium symporter [Aminobacterium sp.]|nr:bile acid:sodium symporter [Aminobacterium sp.]
MLDGMSINVNGAPVVSIPIAICLFFMMYPIMVTIDFASVVKAGKSGKPVFLTLFINWCVKPFTMYAIAMLFLGILLKGLIGAEAVDLVKMPFGLHLPVGAVHGVGTVVLQNGIKMLQIPLWRSYFAGCILLGIAPCTAMVLVWGYLARGNDGLTLVMVAINSLTMLVLYGVLGGFLLGVGKLPVPWQALLLSVAIYVALPLIAGYFSRKWIIRYKGEEWFKEKFLHVLTPVTISALLDSNSAVQLQRRNYSSQPADHFVDFHTVVFTNRSHFWTRLRCSKYPQTKIRRCRSGCHDRCFQPF